MKITFFGTSDFAVPALQALYQKGYEILAVITTPDEPAGRKKVITPPPIKTVALELGLKILQPKSLKITNLKLEIDNTTIGVVASYGKIIPVDILKQFKHGLLNIHPSLLPKYRGASPIQSAILNGENHTGVTIMLLDQELDHGPILNSTKYQVSDIKYHKETEKDLADLGAKLLLQTLPAYLDGKIIPKEQNHAQATFTKKFIFADGKINWQKSALDIFNQIRALNPEPGSWTARKDRPQEILKILKASPLPQTSSAVPGTAVVENQTLLVSTGHGILKLEEIQPAGKNPMTALDFINGLTPLKQINFLV